jgi:anti-sigma factor RsiW
MSFRRDEHLDELISASLSGDITAAERATLDAHLAGCDRCRATLDAFSRERQLLSGMRRAAPPADLGARVRTGIESGRGMTPWWRRPGTLVGAFASLATVAAAVLAVVVFSNITRGPLGATGSPSPSASVAASAAPSASAVPSLEPSQSAAPSAAPLPTVGPDPVGHLEYRVVNQVASLDVVTDAGDASLAVEHFGLPISAALSPAGDWLAFQIRGDGSGLVDTYAYDLADGTLVTLFTGAADSPFAILSWSPDGSLLAFTGLSDDGQSADAWVFSTLDPGSGARQLTNTGRSFSAGFYGGLNGSAWLWVSTAAGGQPTTDRLDVPLDGSIAAPVDPATSSLKHWDGVFLPVYAPHAGTQGGAIAWRGQMRLDADGWVFAIGGMPYLFGPSVEGEFTFFETEGHPLFDTLAIANGGEAFRSARFAWAPDGDGLAVWDAQWQGIPQPAGFPDANRVYFAHPGSGIYIGPDQALDTADTAGGTVVNVALGGGQYLALTVQTAAGSEGGTYGPTAELRVVTRNTGATADEVTTQSADRVWIGPAFYHAVVAPD